MTALRAILGGTFDPVHLGHLHAARAIRRELGLDSVTLVLSARPPHRSAAASAEDRWRMLQIAAADEAGDDGGDDAGIEASDLELRRRGPSYSIDTIEAFRARGETVVWILGSDGLDAFRTWHEYEAFAAACHVAILARPPAAVTALPGFRETGDAAALAGQDTGLLFRAQTPMLDVSATRVRASIACGEDASGLLTPAVWNYIRNRGLYRG